MRARAHRVDLARDGRPLRVLLCYSLSSAGRRLAMAREEKELSEQLEDIGRGRWIEVDVLQYGVTRERLQDLVLRSGGYDVVHFGGHGERDLLVLEREDGAPDPVPGQNFAQHCVAPCGTRLPALVFLSACNSASMLAREAMLELRASLGGQVDVEPATHIGGAALALLTAGVPQVIGMRFEVDDAYARALALWFYDLLLTHGHSASRALALAATRLDAGDHRPRTRLAPVVFGEVDVSFELQAVPSPQRRRRDPRPDPTPAGIKRPATFVGRERELGRLRSDWLHEAPPGAGAPPGPPVAILEGARGVGTSTLLAQLIHRWHHAFDLVLAVRGRCTYKSWLQECIHFGLYYGDHEYKRSCDAGDPTVAVWLDEDQGADADRETRRRAIMVRNLLRQARAHAILFVFDDFDDNQIGGAAEGAVWDPHLAAAIRKLAEELAGTRSRVLIATSTPIAGLGARLATRLPVSPLSDDEMLLLIQDEPGFRVLAGQGQARVALLGRVLAAAAGRPDEMRRLLQEPRPPAASDVHPGAAAETAEAGAPPPTAPAPVAARPQPAGAAPRAAAGDPVGHHLRLVIAEQPALLGLLRRSWGDGEVVRPLLAQRAPSPGARRPVWLAASAEEADVAANPKLLHPFDVTGLIAPPGEARAGSTARWLLLGAAGSGKTTLLRWLALHLARSGDRARIPVSCTASGLLAARPSLLEALECAARRGGPEAEGLAGALDEAGHEGRLVLLVDGLDEVEPARQSDAVTLLRALSARYERSILVVASRPTMALPADDLTAVEILPLDREARVAFLARSFAGPTGRPNHARAGAVVDELAAEPGLWQLAGTPLFLTMIALLLAEPDCADAGADKARLEAMLRPAVMYDRVFTALFEGRHRGEHRPFPNAAAARSALRLLAYAMTAEGVDALPPSRLEALLLEPSAAPVRRAIEAHTPWRDDLRAFLRDVAVRTSILGPHDGDEEAFCFRHRWFREALAGEALAERVVKDGVLDGAALREELGRVRTDADLDAWAEPYALLAGRIAEPDGYIRRLLAERRSLGLRALATAQGVQIETIEEALQLTGDWQKRRVVYERLLVLAGGAARGLALAERLRDKSLGANDLFFIDRAMAMAERRYPSEAGRIAVRRAHLFDDLPAPDRGLFDSIDLRDGRAAAFRMVRAGERGFLLSVVPITNAQFASFDRRRAGAAPDRYPAVRVTWYESVMFCRWLSSCFAWARGARLPTEREWEFAAAQAGAGDVDASAWHRDNSGRRAHAVGEKQPNAAGLHDLLGNVYEWCADAFREAGPETGDAEPAPLDAALEAPDAWRVLRGGCFLSSRDELQGAGPRSASPPERASNIVGFRVLLPLPGGDRGAGA